MKADVIKYFQDFFNNSSFTYFLLDKDLKVISANKSAEKLFEVEQSSKLIGQYLYDLISYDNNSKITPNLLEQFTKTLIQEKGYIQNEKVITESGKEFTGQFEYSMINEENDSFILTCVKNISEELDISETMRTYETIYHQLPDGVVSHSEGRIITCNESFLKYIHEDIEGVMGQSIVSIFSEQDSEKIEKHLQEPIKGKFIIVSKQFEDDSRQKFILESFVTKHKDQDIITTIVSDYQLQEDLAKEQLRANLASEANILLEREIIKHKETQRKLEASQEISKSVFNSSIDTIISTDLENNVTEVSPSACYAFKYSREEFMSLNAKDLYANKDEFSSISNSLKNEGFYIGEVINVRKDGTQFTCFLSCAVMRNKKGDQIGYMGISRDITDIKKAEEELIKSEKKYRDLFVNLGDALVIVDKDNRIIDLNNAAKALFDNESCIGKDLFDFVHPDDLELVHKRSKEFRHKGNIVNVEFRLLTDSKVKYVTLSSTAIFEGDTYVGSRDILRDVTQEKEYQDLISKQTSHLNSIFENKSDVIMCTLNSDFGITSFNSKLKEYVKFHFDVELDLGMNFMELLQANVSDKVRSNLVDFYNQATLGHPTQFDGILKGRNGEEIWIETFLSPIKVEGKSKYDIALMALDITDKKEAELEITKSLREKEVLLKEVHHRVKNNLQVISSILNLQSSYVKDHNTLEILRESQNRVKSMSFIHESLYRSKDFSQVNFSDYLNNLINNVVHTFLLPDKDVMLMTDLGAVNLNLDQAIPCGLILNELLTNAMKYAFVGIENPTLEVKIQEENNSVSIWVIDNGVGLPKDFKIDETDSLGLQLVQTLTDQLDGTLDMKTGDGTKYLLTFEKVNQPD